jgi:hypothetical protein
VQLNKSDANEAGSEKKEISKTESQLFRLADNNVSYYPLFESFSLIYGSKLYR